MNKHGWQWMKIDEIDTCPVAASCTAAPGTLASPRCRMGPTHAQWMTTPSSSHPRARYMVQSQLRTTSCTMPPLHPTVSPQQEVKKEELIPSLHLPHPSRICWRASGTHELSWLRSLLPRPFGKRQRWHPQADSCAVAAWSDCLPATNQAASLLCISSST